MNIVLNDVIYYGRYSNGPMEVLTASWPKLILKLFVLVNACAREIELRIGVIQN